MSVGTGLLFVLIGFWWGEWHAERKARKTIERDGAAFKLLYRMVTAILDKRKLVGGYLTITLVERFDIMGERFALSLQSKGDPAAKEPSDA